MNNKTLRKVTCSFLVLLVLFPQAGCRQLLEEDEFYEYKVDEGKTHTVEAFDLKDVPVQEEEEDIIKEITTLVEGQDKIDLSLQQCRAIALENNLDLKVSLIDPTIAEEAIIANEAFFEPTLNLASGLSKTDTAVFTQLEGTQGETKYGRASLGIPLRTGGNIELALVDYEQESNNSFTTINPVYYGDFQLSVSQPLLQGAGSPVQKHLIRIAKYDKQLADISSKVQVITVLRTIDDLYWDLYAARKKLEVRVKQHELARAQLDRTRRLVDAGQQAPVELVRSEAGLARQLASIIETNQAIRDKERQIKVALNKFDIPVEGNTVIKTTTEPNPVRYKLDREKMLEFALEHRMELLEAELRIAKIISEIEQNRNLLLPSFVINYTYNINSLGISRRASYRMLNDKNFEDHAIGLNLSMPLGNNAAKSRMRQALYRRRKELATAESQRLVIRRDVLNVIDLIEKNWQQLMANQQSAILEGRLYEAEVRQFEVGLRTSTDVFEAQANFVEAQSSEIDSLVAYQKALSALAEATGTVLGSAKVNWAPFKPEIGMK